MEVKTLVERLEELPEEFGMSFFGLSVEAGLNEKIISNMRASLLKGQDISFSKVNNIAKGLGLITVVFYRESDGLVEELKHPHFLYGEEIYNYTGEVFTKYRKLLGLEPSEIAQQIGINTRMVSNYENGKLPMLHRIEEYAKALGLIPDYLVQKIQENLAGELKPSS